MMQFDPQEYRYPSKRNVVYARHAMACTSVPLSAQIGLQIMKEGGNAMDAAVAMAAAMPLMEPTGNGLGADCFALVWVEKEKKLYGLNASGVSPASISGDKLKVMGMTEIPKFGWTPTMVPGAPAGWAAVQKRFGTKTLAELFAPAIGYARDGYPIPVEVGGAWSRSTKRYAALAQEKPELFGPWCEAFMKSDGTAYGPGDIFRWEDYARTLEELAATDCESYYRGAIMEKIVAFSRKTGGWFSEDDFRNYYPEWVEPITADYKGYTVCEIPPNGHGITALMALNILKGLELPAEKECAETYHKIVESIKLAFADTKTYVADPRYMKTKVADLLSEEYAAKRRALIGDEALTPEAGDPSCGGTIYLCTADPEGNMVSFIQSNYMGFGSGIVVPGTGISLQNRGCNFSMDSSSDNYLQGGKKAYHTIIPGFMLKDGEAVGPFGVMGGFMQPQGHVLVAVNSIDYHMNPQEVLDAPRLQWTGDKHVELEHAVAAEIAKQLAEKGHDIEVVKPNAFMGRGQIIWRTKNGLLVGGTESRCDGCVAAW